MIDFLVATVFVIGFVLIVWGGHFVGAHECIANCDLPGEA
jgi:hypothetical protein